MLPQIVQQVYQNRTDVLSKEETYTLIQQSQNGNILSRNELIERNLGLIFAVTRKYSSFTNLQEDLFQEGILGMITAIERFKIDMDLEFSTYAIIWIKQGIQRYLKNHLHLIRIPVYVQDIQSRYQSLKRQNTDKEEEFFIKLLALERGIPEENIIKHLTVQQKTVSIFLEREDGSPVFQFEQFLEEEIEDIKYIDFEKLYSYLSHNERTIIKMRMDNYTRQAIANVLNISRERVRQVEKIAMVKLKGLLLRTKRRQYANS